MLTTLLAVALTGAAPAATFTVCPSGCDFTTIAAAEAAASNGDSIFLDIGFPVVHTEQGVVTDKFVTILGNGRDVTIWQAAATPGVADGRHLTVGVNGAVFLSDMTLRHGNVTGDGGAVHAMGSLGVTTQLTVGRARFAWNQATGCGGAVYTGTAFGGGFSSTAFEDNQADRGGALCLEGAGANDTIVNTSLFQGNQARLGGAIYSAGVFDGFDVTITGNEASEDGGGFYGPTDQGRVGNATIVGNTAPTSGTGGYVRGSSVANGTPLRSSVVALNVGGDCDSPRNASSSWDGDGSCNTGGSTGDPRLQPLRDNSSRNGLPTMAPREDSPLIDAATASCTFIDQRLLDRELGGAECDIGAHERWEFKTCQSPFAAIPDDDADGWSQTVSFASVPGVFLGHRVIDVKASVFVTHSWVGDLVLELEHDGRRALLMDRPGVPASTFGCSGNNVLATFDRDAALPVEDQCAGGTPTIGGRVRPNSSLTAWNGQTGVGDWTLTARDVEGGETGQMVTWCLYVEMMEDFLDLPIFEDGFESADTSAWSATTP
ncbi:MAG: hypothetical protein DWQ36_15575 [Acidobacteria bacterium]|nr:MAG: hypothetical protein DWQ30_01600 [Acidobacteriota bacterium]REK05924.1 MAG: hypothetical protein DWQ36_15575 [Acidobacteriota bacterium]